MLFAVTLAKVAGIATLLILGWIVIQAMRSRVEEVEEKDVGQAEPAAGPKPDRMGRLLMRGFTAMLIIGVGSAFAISFGEVLQAL
jgi:hypothetical protein